MISLAALLSCLASSASRANDARCRVLRALEKAASKTIVLIAGVVAKKAPPLLPPPTKTSPLWLPPSPTFLNGHNTPWVFWFVVTFMGTTTALAVTAALVKIKVIQAVREMIFKSLRNEVRRFKSLCFLFLVAWPLYIVGDTDRLYALQDGYDVLALHVRSRKRRNGTRGFSIILWKSDAALFKTVLQAYFRIGLACVETCGKLITLTGYATVVQVPLDLYRVVLTTVIFAKVVLSPAPVQLFPGFDCILHPALPLPINDLPLRPLPKYDCMLHGIATIKVAFWDSHLWKPVTCFPIPNAVSPAALRPVKSLGSGAFGDVLKVRLAANRATLAVKRIRRRHDRLEMSFRLEVNVHLLMNDHAAFPSLHGVFRDGKYFYLAMDCGQVCMVDMGRLERRQALFYGAQLVLATHALHKRGVVHLDVKHANLLLGHDGYLKLIDYGLAVIFGNDPQREDWPEWHALRDAGTDAFPLLWADEEDEEMINPDVYLGGGGTPLYMSPLVKDHCRFSYGADLWSVGVVLYEWLTDEFPEFGPKPGYRWCVDRALRQSADEIDFFERIFSVQEGVRFEDWEDLKAHPLWDTYMHDFQDIQDAWARR